MIPLARDAVMMTLWTRTETEDDGQVTEGWEASPVRLACTLYPISDTRAQIEDGQTVKRLVKVHASLPHGTDVYAGDRLGSQSAMQVHLIDVRTAEGRLTATGERL